MKKMKFAKEQGFIPLLVLAAIFMAGAVLALGVSSLKSSLPSLSLPYLPQSVLSLPKTTLIIPSYTSSPSAQNNSTSSSTPTLELPTDSIFSLNSSPSPVSTPVQTPLPVFNPPPENKNQNSEYNLNFLANGAIDIEYTPKLPAEVLIFPLDTYSPSLVKLGDVSYVSMPPGKYLLHFSNPQNLGMILPNDSSIEINSNKTTLIKVNLLNGELSTTFGWAP